MENFNAFNDSTHGHEILRMQLSRETLCRYVSRVAFEQLSLHCEKRIIEA